MCSAVQQVQFVQGCHNINLPINAEILESMIII